LSVTKKRKPLRIKREILMERRGRAGGGLGKLVAYGSLE